MASLYDYAIYPEEYFSGSDVSIYFGSEWVDEINAITFVLSEFVQPIYGFNSYTYDYIQRGARLVRGSFRINFREAGYLMNIVNNASAKKIGKVSEFLNNNYYKERFDAEAGKSDLSKESSEPDNWNAEAKEMSASELKSKAKDFQKAFWGETKTEAQKSKTFFPTNGFTIKIMYGSPMQMVTKNAEYDRLNDLPAYTTMDVVDVQLVSVNQVIGADGSPVFEDYQFFAKDLHLG
jgi:hypothetical protein